MWAIWLIPAFLLGFFVGAIFRKYFQREFIKRMTPEQLERFLKNQRDTYEKLAEYNRNKNG